MDKNILEFWGQAFLNAARSQQQMEDMSKYFGQDTGIDNPIINSFLKSFGWQKPGKMDTENVNELIPKSFNAYKEFLKACLTMADVVSKEEHLKVIEENEELKEKISRQEKIISDSQKQVGKEGFNKEEVVNNLAHIMKNQTQQFQELMKQVNQYYKKGAPTKKK